MEILIFIEHLLKPLLNLEGTDGAQALERGREVGEDWTASLGGTFTENNVAQSLEECMSLIHSVPFGLSHSFMETYNAGDFEF